LGEMSAPGPASALYAHGKNVDFCWILPILLGGKVFHHVFLANPYIS